MANVLRAGAGETTPGEEEALRALAALPNAWTVIANKILAINAINSFEIDFIVIGPHRIVILDEKSYRGRITGTDEIWTRSGGDSIQSPFGKIDMIARKLSGSLDRKVTGFPGKRSGVVPVVGGVILSNDTADAQIRDLRASRCLLTGANAIEKLLWLDNEARAAGFDLLPIHSQISTTLFNDNRAHRPKRPSTIGMFSIDDEVDARDGCRVFLATNEAGSRRTLYVYPNHTDAGAALDRDLHALALLQPTGAVPLIGDAFPWSDDAYRVVPVRPPAGTSIGARPGPTSRDTAIREIEAAAAAFHALGQVHEQGVVHRAIRPETVSIDDPSPPAPGAREATLPRATISGFVAAHIDQAATIAPALDAGDFADAYAAPEITRLGSYGFADVTSDVYSLSLIVLERLAGAPLAELLPNDAWRSTDPVKAPWPYLGERVVDDLRDALGQGLTSGAYANEPRSTASSLADDLIRIAQSARNALPWEKGPVAGTDLEVKALLGEGSSARTYLLYDTTNDRTVAGKEFYRPDALQEAVHEFNLLFDHQHPNLPKVVGKPDKSRPHFQILLEYIQGETLEGLIPAITHDRETWTRLMHDLLAALEHLEQHGLLHRDIKPANVMIRDADGRAFLIDYGSSATADEPGLLSGSPRYWPPEWKQDGDHPPGADRYAAAVTLFEALTGSLPFKATGSTFHGELADALPADLPKPLHGVAATLRDALTPDPATRFPTAAALRAALDGALAARSQPLPADGDTHDADWAIETSRWIDSVRGLFRNSARGNADNRGLETEFARATYVPTALDTDVGPALAIHKPAVIFLSGNPGDGKTAFLEEVRRALEHRGGRVIAEETDPSGWEISHASHTFRACFDASESANGRSADDQLAHRLRGLYGATPAGDVTVLVAINDGRLAEARHTLHGRFPWLFDAVRRVESRPTPTDIVRDRVWLIDLKRRSYVSITPDPDAPSVMRRMLGRLVAPERWSAASTESYHPIAIENAAALRREGAHSPAARLERLFTLAHLRGDRHMTVRDLRSALSYLITFDLDPDATPAPGSGWTGKYWNTLFTTGSNTDLVLGELEWLDPARFAHPELERFLHFRHRPEDAPVRARLFANGVDEPPPAGADAAGLSAWIDAVKRRLAIEGATDSGTLPIPFNPDDLQPYHSAAALIAILNGTEPPATLLPQLLRGIGRSDGIDEARRTDDLVLRVKKSDEYDIEIVKRFPLADFDLRVDGSAASSLVESIPRTLLLLHEKSGARVRLNLDVIEVLVRLADGLDPASQELGPLLEELLPFKSRVQRDATQQLLVIEGGRKHTIERRNGKLVRTDG